MMIRRLFVISIAVAAYCLAAAFVEDAASDCGSAMVSGVQVCDSADDATAAADNVHTILPYGFAHRADALAVSYTGGCTAPVSVRSLSHDARPVWRHVSCGFMARAIDSSRAAGCYGLYNHKILFASRSVDQYLHKMCRLVI